MPKYICIYKYDNGDLVMADHVHEVFAPRALFEETLLEQVDVEDFLIEEEAGDGFYAVNFLNKNVAFLGTDMSKITEELDGKYIDLEEIYSDEPPDEEKLAQLIKEYEQYVERRKSDIMQYFGTISL